MSHLEDGGLEELVVARRVRRGRLGAQRGHGAQVVEEVVAETHVGPGPFVRLGQAGEVEEGRVCQ